MQARERLYFGNSRKPITKAILHAAAVPEGWAADKTLSEMVETIRAWHKAKGWNDIGYHYVVSPHGHVSVGRPLHMMGAHTIGHNSDSLGILMVENHQIKKMGEFHDFYTERQRIAVGEILRYHRITEIHGHNEFAPKLCPGFDVRKLPKGFFDREEQMNLWQRIGAILFPKNLTQE